jgi:GGDEF domain-containing protein
MPQDDGGRTWGERPSGRPTRIAVDGLLGRALRDPETGLPNAPFFSLIRDWEERRARRRKYRVRVRDISVRGGSERARGSLSWHLAQALRASDLVASQGRERYRVLLTSPDAEHADQIRERIERVVRALPDGERVAVAVAVEDERRHRAR